MDTLRNRFFLTRGIIEIGIFSAVANVLLLVQPLYLLQVYDRVVASSSINTLIYLSIFAVGALCVLGILEVVRSQYANRMAKRIDAEMGSSAFLAAMNGPRAGLGDVQPLRDLATIRGFISSRTVFFLFDVPFAPFFIAVLYLVHPYLFWITLFGALILILVVTANQLATTKRGKSAAESLVGAMNMAQSYGRNFETLRALGMVSNVTEHWGSRFSDAVESNDRVAAVNAAFSGASRTLRMLLQIAILGIGGYLVVSGQMTAGMIFASSILSGRALQPLDQIIGGWRQIIEAWRAWKRLRAIDLAMRRSGDAVALPDPKGEINVENLTYFLPGAEQGTPPLIKRISFSVKAGESVAIIGASRAGKSTLARLLVGAIRPNAGVVRLDGSDLQNWDPDHLGRHIGYLSQEVELFPGTIAENISRFEPNAEDATIIEAANWAKVHDLILSQKRGYSTDIGPTGVRLSGGERQRIGLARAFYGNPRIVVLDEPNANLDQEGEQALEKALEEAGRAGTTSIIITHRPSIATKCDRVMMLRDGQIELYGPAQEVLQRLAQGGNKPNRTTVTDAATDEAARTGQSAARGAFGSVIRAKSQ